MITLYMSELKDIMFAITKWAGCILLVVIALILTLRLFGKPWYYKARSVFAVIVIIIVGLWTWFILPRFLDYRTRSFITQPNATLYLDPTNIDNGNTWRLGTGKIKTTDSTWIMLDGLDFIDFPIENGQPNTFRGLFVYGERSKQLVYYELENPE